MTSIEEHSWSSWSDLKDSKNLGAPALPGLYRIRDSHSKHVLYVGETGAKSGLRGRLNQLRTCFNDEMPFADPHTAAPALWAFLADGGGPLEASFLVLDSDKPTRRALEATAVSLVRQQNGESPMFSFGRMPAGWIKSTGNNKWLTQQGKRARGYRDPLAQRVPSVPCILDTEDDPKSSNWCGLEWSEWSDHVPPKLTNGLYRIASASQNGLLYIGEGQILKRLNAHKSKTSDSSHPQSTFFSGEILMSWIEMRELASVQRRELENDLIASHHLVIGSPPPAQFIG